MALNYVDHPVHVHSEVSGQPGHYQGEAVEPGKCVSEVAYLYLLVF